MSEDDAPAFDDETPVTRGRARHPQCLSTVPDYRHASFQPHAIDYQKVQVLTGRMSDIFGKAKFFYMRHFFARRKASL